VASRADSSRGENGTERVIRSVPIIDRIRNFLRSPQGQRIAERGRRMAADPRNRDRARGLLARLRRR
jgi:hypothetical protein